MKHNANREVDNNGRYAMKFVILMGVVSLFAET